VAVAGKLADDVGYRAALEGRQPVFSGPGPDLTGSARPPAASTTQAAPVSPQRWSGHAHDRDLRHRGMAIERLFYLGRIDVLSAADVHVLDPVDDPDVRPSAPIAATSPGVQPAVLDGLRRRVRTAPVPGCDASPGDPQLTRLAGTADPAAVRDPAAQVPHRHADVARRGYPRPAGSSSRSSPPR